VTAVYEWRAPDINGEKAWVYWWIHPTIPNAVRMELHVGEASREVDVEGRFVGEPMTKALLQDLYNAAYGQKENDQ
jgi:hypothetical protein